MNRISRRMVLKGAVCVPAALCGSRVLTAAEDGKPAGADVERPYEFALPSAGRVKPVASAAIDASPLGVGFETLDRRHFDPARTYAHLAALGVKWARCQTGWSRCETKPGQYDFQWLDDVVDSLRKIGVRPWFNLTYGNALYTAARDQAAVGYAPIFDDKARGAWTAFVRALAAHFHDRVEHWEIWNEPNIPNFWQPKRPDPDDYVELVKLSVPEIRRSIAKAVIIGGAYAGIPQGYIRGCFRAGLAEHVDKISYHPYRAIPEKNYDAEIAGLRRIIAESKKPLGLWQGENGCPSQRGGAGALANLAWTERSQAKWLLRRILTDLRLEIELVSYYHLVNLVGYRGTTNHKGLLRGNDYTPKPAYFAYQCLCSLFDARSVRDAGLDLGVVGQEKVDLQWTGFSRGGRAMYVYWFPANLQEPWPPRKLDVKLHVTPQAALENPVLVDLLTGRAYRLAGMKRGPDHASLEGVPLLDYPLLITDQALLEEDEHIQRGQSHFRRTKIGTIPAHPKGTVPHELERQTHENKTVCLRVAPSGLYPIAGDGRRRAR